MRILNTAGNPLRWRLTPTPTGKFSTGDRKTGWKRIRFIEDA
jgi:hypothetical protein